MIALIAHDQFQGTRLRTLVFDKALPTTYFWHGQLSLLGRLSSLRLGMLSTSSISSILFSVLVVVVVKYVSSAAFGCEFKLLFTTDFVHKRIGININFLLLVFLSFPTPLQHHHAVVLAPCGNTLCALLVMGSHHSCHR